MPTRRFSRGRARAPRRRLEWVDFQGDVAAIPIGDYVALDSLQGFEAIPGASTVGASVVRIHARLWVTSTVVNGDGISWSWIVAPNSANQPTAAPIASARALSPINQPQADWIMYQKFNAHPAYSFNGAVNNLEMDIRSKRRLKELGDSLYMVFENVDASAPVSIAFHARVLLALA